MKKVVVSITIFCLLSSVLVFPRFSIIASENQLYVQDDDLVFSSYNFTEKELLVQNHGREQIVDSSKGESPVSSRVNSSGLMDSAWPMYCHDACHTGQSPYSTQNVTGVELWRWYYDNWILGSPALDVNGTVHFGGPRYYFTILSNGTEQWRYRIYDAVEGGTALDASGISYYGISRNSGSFQAVDASGSRLWYILTGQIFTSPTIDSDGTIYFGTQGGKDSEYGSIYALNPNGTVKWRYQTGHVVYSSPAIGPDGTVYCGSHDTYLYALNPINGSLKWRFKTNDWIRVSPCIAPNGTIYVVSLDSSLYAINPNGTMKWKTDVGAGTSPTLGSDGTIYCGWKRLTAVAPDGHIKWTYDTGSAIEGGTPCHSADGTIYLGTADGTLIAVNPDGTEQWHKQLGNIIQSAPIIGEDGTLYICSGDFEQIDELGDIQVKGYLHAFRLPTKNTPPQIPVALTGPETGKIHYTYFFATSTVDPDLNPVSYLVDWGDGSSPAWSKDYASNETAHLSHAWERAGNYTIRVKARDSLGVESNWSEPTTIAIHTNVYIVSVRGGIGITVGIQSVSNTTLTNLNLHIHFGIMITILYPWTISIEKSVPALPPGDKTTIHAGLIGFGKDTITIWVGDDLKYREGAVIGPFVFFGKS